MVRRLKKSERHDVLQTLLMENSFLTDEELACHLQVSIQTIRLDRLELGIPEVRERIRSKAQQTAEKIKAINSNDLMGEVIDLEIGNSGISVLEVIPAMVFGRTRVAQGHFIYAQANSLALAVTDATAAVTGVANIKFKRPVYVNDKLIAKAEVMRTRGNKSFVWVKTRVNEQEVFRGKFIIVSLQNTGSGL